MGVVRERKAVCEPGSRVPSNAESVQNSGYTTQEEDDYHQPETRRIVRRPHNVNLNIDFSFNLSKHAGRRRIQRVINRKFLETLKEEGEHEDDAIVESTKSKFQILMERSENPLELLNEYELQLEAMEYKDSCDKEVYHDTPYLNIPRKIRIAINNRKNFQYELLQSIENKFATELRDDTLIYHHYPDSYYERLLVHAAARYHGFQSETLISNGKKLVKVMNAHIKILKTKLLCDVIQEMRKNLQQPPSADSDG